MALTISPTQSAVSPPSPSIPMMSLTRVWPKSCSTNESIALNTYSIANQKQTVNPKLMNSDELVVNEVNQMVPVINHHHYKKSMINPATLFKPSLEIQLPEVDHEALLSKQIKQDSSTHKSSPFLPKMMITPNKK